MNSISDVAHNMVAELSHNLNSILASGPTSKNDNRIRKPVGAAIGFPRLENDEQLDTLSIASSRRSKKNKGEKYKLTEDSMADRNERFEAKNRSGSIDRLKGRVKPVKKLLQNSSFPDDQKAKVNRNVLKKVSKLQKSTSNHSLSKKKTSLDKKKPLTRQPKKVTVMKRIAPKVLPREAKSSERCYAVSKPLYLSNVGDEEEEEQEVGNIYFEENSKEVRNKPLESETNNNYHRENDGENHALNIVDYSPIPYTHNYLKPTMAHHLKCVQHNYWRHYSDCRLPFVVGTSVSTTNNVRLLRQQTASKIKTFLLYNVSCDQLSDFKLYKLRDLIREVEKNGRKVTGSSSKSHPNNQENVEESSPDNNLELEEN